MMYKDFKDVLLQNEKEAPYTILDEIEIYMDYIGKLYRRGRISETELFLQTQGWHVFDTLLGKVNQLKLRSPFIADEDGFVDAWNTWKAKGILKEAKWMDNALSQTGDIMESAEWLFDVIETLKIPLSYLMDSFGNYSGILPKVRYSCTDEAVSLFYTGRPDNINELTEHSNPFGKKFHFVVDENESIDITIGSVKDNLFGGLGIISGYMTGRGAIFMHFLEDGNVDIRFALKRLSQYDLRVARQMIPISHPQWDAYNKAFRAYAINAEADYKILRIPYLLGHENDGKRKREKRRVQKAVHLIKA